MSTSNIIQPPRSDAEIVEARKLRDEKIFPVLERCANLWTGPASTADETGVSSILALVLNASKITEGSWKKNAVQEIIPSQFLLTFREKHERKEYQWIFSSYWSGSERVLTAEESDVSIVNFSAEIWPLLESFITRKDAVPLWSPDDPNTENASFFESLQIPVLQDGPDMLLHNLGSFMDHPVHRKRIDKIFTRKVEQVQRHVVLLNTPGSGKTRLLLEGLCRYWGFYFTSVVDVNDHGSHDLENAIIRVQEHSGFSSPLPATDYKDKLFNNCRIAENEFLNVFASRLIIFNLFCQVARESNSNQSLTNEHRKRWLLLQLRPSFLGSSYWDIFDHLSQMLRGSTTGYLSDKCRISLGVARRHVSAQGNRAPFFCVIDEAQSAASKCTTDFRSVTKDKMRSILRELVHTWAGPELYGMYLIISGTAMSQAVIEETMASAVLKGGRYETIKDVGGFETLELTVEYLASLMPDKIRSTESMLVLGHRVAYYLHGRFRFTAAFMRELLRAEYKSPHRLFNAFIKKVTSPEDNDVGGFQPTDAEEFWEPKECGPIGELKKFKFEKLKRNNALMLRVQTVVQQFFMRSELTMNLGPAEHQAVEFGFARFRTIEGPSKQLTVIDEPLAVLALIEWLPKNGLPIWDTLALDARNAKNEAGGYNTLEEYFGYYFSTVFDGVRPLDQIFVFDRGGALPDWALKPAKLVSLYQVNNTPPQRVIESGFVGCSARPSIALATSSGSYEHTKLWLDYAYRSAICFPDVLMGPDILFILELWNKKRIWVAVQSKYSHDDLLNWDTFVKALASVKPSKFYHNHKTTGGENRKSVKMDVDTLEPGKKSVQEKRNEETMRYLDALPNRLSDGTAGEFSLLRVIASWPSNVDLHWRGKKMIKMCEQGRQAKTHAEKTSTPSAKIRDSGPTAAASDSKLVDDYQDPQKHPIVDLNMDTFNEVTKEDWVYYHRWRATNKSGTGKRPRVADEALDKLLPERAIKRQKIEDDFQAFDASREVTPMHWETAFGYRGPSVFSDISSVPRGVSPSAQSDLGSILQSRAETPPTSSTSSHFPGHPAYVLPQGVSSMKIKEASPVRTWQTSRATGSSQGWKKRKA
ncbi:hypothetical protein B0H10DRAFT_2186505 [Mycena sp. CBHHK59/15]|nr:hypothetical protein B0H10DRAFT_2186505 [Mycena sp. CBHHK59/15]